MYKKILITGSSGFIGRSLKRFIEDRYPYIEVFGLTRRSRYSDKNVFHCDLNNEKKLYDILTTLRPHCIFHLAGGRPSGEQSIFEANFLTTWSLLKTIERISHYCPRIVIPGTAAEYGFVGRDKKALTENMTVQPASWYGFVKYIQTSLGLMYVTKDLDVIVARMFNILGVGTPPTLVMGRFAQEVVLIEKKKKASIICAKNLGGKRDFLDIHDICSALCAVAIHGKSGEVYNICSGRAYTIRDLLRKLLRYSTVKNILIKEEKENFSESFDTVGSNKKICTQTNWKPKTTIDQSLKATLDYYRKDGLRKG